MAKDFIDFIGQKYNRLTVLEKTSQKIGSNYLWKCKCDCGNETLATRSAIITGRKKSCGCLHTEQRSKLGKSKGKDLYGLEFGDLKVLKKTDKRKDGRIVWKCQCSCGNFVLASSHDLLANRMTHCGCKRVGSKGETKIKKILQDYHLMFEQEKTFPDLKTNGKNLRFDFFVENKFLIEYDGIQHFIKDSGYGSELENIQKRDMLKTQYAEEHDIPLIRINYLDFDNFGIKDLIPKQFIYLLEKE